MICHWKTDIATIGYLNVAVLVAQLVERCVSNALVVDLILREKKIFEKKSIDWVYCKSLSIKASARCT